MAESSEQNAEAQPADFVRAAWHAVKRGPLTVVLKLGLDFGANILGGAAVLLALVGALIILFVGPSTEAAIGLAGAFAAALGIFLAADAYVMGAVWMHGARVVRDRPQSSPWWQVLKDGFDGFGQALALRALNFTTRGALVALFFAWSIPLLVISTRAGGLWGSPVWVPAAIAGVAATLYSLASALFVLTIELSAPAVFLGKMRLGEAIVDAATKVLESPVRIYRVFVTALSILLPALFLAWGASILYAMTFEMPMVAPWTGLVRTLANLVLFGTLGLFVVMLQYSFFAYWSHREGLLTSLPKTWSFVRRGAIEVAVGFEQLIPRTVVHRIPVDEALSTTRLEEPIAPAAQAAEPVTAETVEADDSEPPQSSDAPTPEGDEASDGQDEDDA